MGQITLRRVTDPGGFSVLPVALNRGAEADAMRWAGYEGAHGRSLRPNHSHPRVVGRANDYSRVEDLRCAREDIRQALGYAAALAKDELHPLRA